jgi:5'-deoxynucleotidase YfbR-like HD superfamily hydrolase
MSRENSILTFTNTLFYPLDPRPDEVKTEDIAHALSQMCRANGHFKIFYSVAQHSINCAQEARESGLSVRIQLACLLHDACEAYISDITRPVKYYLDEYRAIEHRLQSIIFAKFGIGDLTEEELRHVADIDNALLYYEFEQLHHQGLPEYPYKLASKPDVSEKRMTAVEAEFMQLTRQIMNTLKL